MKLRYDFNASQKTYRTFPQKVAQSTGLLDRFSFLTWCCPFCLEKPRSNSRKSSVPVIRITRPRSPDSDLDEEDEEEEPLRRDSVGSAGSDGSPTKSGRGATIKTSGGGDGGADAVSLESSLGSGELDIINEEMDEAKDYDSESIESKESIRSKTSIHSKSSTVKEKGSVKSKSSWKGNKDKGSRDDSKESRKSSKESLRSSRDSVKDKDSHNEKTRSPMKKLIKHLKRTASSPSPIGRSGDKRSASTRSTTSLEDGGGKGGGRTGSKKFSFTSASGEWRTRSSTVDSRVKTLGRDGKVETRKSATGEVIGQGVVLAKSNNAVNNAVKSATLNGRGCKGMETSLCDGNTKEEEEEAKVFRTNATWETKLKDDATTGNSHSANLVDAKMKGKRDGRIFSHPTDLNEKKKEAGIGKNTEPSPPHRQKARMMAAEDDDDDDDDDDDEVTFKSPQKSLRKDSGRETGSEIGVGEIEGGGGGGGVRPTEREDIEGGRGKTGKDVRGGRGRKHCVDQDDEGEEGGGETTESSPPETPAAKGEGVYDSSSTKPSSGFEDESTGSLEEGLGQKSGSPSPLVGSVGRISGRESVASLASSTDNSTVTHPDEDIERLMQITEKKRNSLTPLGRTNMRKQ